MKIIQKFLKAVILVLLLSGCSNPKPGNPVAQGGFKLSQIWVAETQEPVLNTPIIEDDRVFVRTEKAVYAFSALDGSLLWRSTIIDDNPYHRNPPQFAVHNGVVIVPAGRAAVIAISSEDGTLLWQDTQEHTTGVSEVHAISFQGDIVYVARHNSFLIAYDLNTGEMIWRVPAPSRKLLRLSSNDGFVYFSVDDTLWVYDAQSGKQIFEKESDIYTGPIIAGNGVLYLVEDTSREKDGQGGGFMAMDVNTFEKIWYLELPYYDILNENALTIVDKLLFLSGDGLSVIDTMSGELLWFAENKVIGTTSHPVVLDNIVYVRNRAGKLFAFDSTTGTKKGYLQLMPSGNTNNPTELGPAVYGDTIIVPYGDNRIYAYRP